MATNPEGEEEAQRLKSMAEAKFASFNLNSALKHAKKAQRLRPDLDGVSAMVTALKILLAASKVNFEPDPQVGSFIDYYKVLQVEPFSHINTIKKQYKKLALLLHPDKNKFLGCEEAFKLVGEGFRVFSDKIRRKEYDMRLRIRIQEEERGKGYVGNFELVETFWTACSRCRLLHQFERRYLGHSLVCPSCKMSFEAVEVGGGDLEKGDEGGDCGVEIGELGSRQVGVGVKRNVVLGLKRKVGSDEDVEAVKRGDRGIGNMGSVAATRGASDDGMDGEGVTGVGLGSGEWGGGRLRTGGLRRRMSAVGDVLESSEPKRVKFAEDTMTLAEMQLQMRQKIKAGQKKVKMNESQKIIDEKEKEKEKEKRIEKEKDKEKHMVVKNGGVLDIEKGWDAENNGVLVFEQGGASKSLSSKFERHRRSVSEAMENTAVVESDFYDFGSDRVEKSFKKGQVWAIYDGDRMPRCYGLIEEVISMKPFQVKLSWLDLQTNGDQVLLRQERMGFHLSCGRFKVSRKLNIKSVDIFSHAAESERAAREAYRIYPTKGSVWALYNEATLADGRRNMFAGDKHCFDIVVFLTTYSEVHGLSMAYLEKVDGFKTIFKRREIGCHAIRYLKKDDIRLISHQIPARKLSGDEPTVAFKDCWELDPASLPQDLVLT